MGNNDGCCKATEPDVIFSELIRELAGEVDQASYNADAYRNKVNKIDCLLLECDREECMPADSKVAEIPDTVVYKLRAIVNQLRLSNRKNTEIIQHLNTLV
jgi:hypothetical protein